MYFVYIDETGNRDPRMEIPRKDGTTIPGDPLYVLTGVCLFEHHWHGFEKTLNRHKIMLIDLINRSKSLRLQLADCEVKSNWLRQPKARKAHPFLSNITDSELTKLTDLFYEQLNHCKMHIFSVIVDKRYLRPYMDQEKIHRKSWEYLLISIERFMRSRHPKHQALMMSVFRKIALWR